MTTSDDDVPATRPDPAGFFIRKPQMRLSRAGVRYMGRESDDDDPIGGKDFSREDVLEIRKLLLAVEEGHLLHFNDPQQLEVFKRVMHTFTEHREEIAEIIRREQVSKLWAETRLKFWGVIKWFLATFLLIVGVIQGWQSVIGPLLKKGGGE